MAVVRVSCARANRGVFRPPRPVGYGASVTRFRGAAFWLGGSAIVMGVGCQRPASPTAPSPPPTTAPAASASAGPARIADEVRFCTESVHPAPKGWHCVGEVTAGIAQKRNRIIRVTLRQGRVVRDELVNGHGRPAEAADWAVIDYSHDAEGNLREQTTVDRFGVVRHRQRFSADGKRAELLDPWGALTINDDDDSSFTVALHDFDARGLRVRTTYFDAEGKKRHSANGAHEQRFTYAPDGFLTTSYEGFGEDGKPFDDRDGDQRSVTERSEWGPTLRRFFSRDGTPSRSGGKRFGFRQSFDAIGNVFFWEDLDEKGAPFDDAGRHVAREVHVYDDHGDRIESRYLRADGSPFIGNYSLVRRTFDDRGRITIMAYLDAAGNPTRTGGYAREERDYDAANALTEIRFFKANGEPGRGKQGSRWARTTFRYDGRHNDVETRFLAADGSPGANDEGVSTITRRFHRDREVVLERRGPNGQLHAVQGVARVTSVRDATAAIVERRCEDARDEPVKAYDLLTFRVGYVGSRTPVDGMKRTREEARVLADKLLAEVRAGRSIYSAASRHADFADARPERAIGENVIYPELREALFDVPVGGTTNVVDAPNGFLVTRRLR